MFRHPCHQNLQGLVLLNSSWVPRNFHPAELDYKYIQQRRQGPTSGKIDA
jgi:hypothetical protein